MTDITEARNVEVKTVAGVAIYLDKETGRFSATVKRKGRYGSGSTGQVITRASLADVEREVLKQSVGRIELLNAPKRKGREGRSGYGRDAVATFSYGPSNPLHDLPSPVVIVAEGGKRQYSAQTWRTENNVFISGPFVRPNAELMTSLTRLLERHAEAVADFEREWDGIVERFEVVDDATLKAELAGMVAAAKAPPAEAPTSAASEP